MTGNSGKEFFFESLFYSVKEKIISGYHQ